MTCPKCGREVGVRVTAGGQEWLAEASGRRHACEVRPARKTRLSRETKARMFWNIIFASDPDEALRVFRVHGFELE